MHGTCINPLNAELNPIRHLLALVGARHIVHVSRVSVKIQYSCLASGRHGGWEKYVALPGIESLFLGRPLLSPVTARASYCKLSQEFAINCDVNWFGRTQRTCASVARTSGDHACDTGLKINEDSWIIGMAFRFTLPATHTYHYLALAVGIFGGLLTMVATQLQVIKLYPRPVFLKI